MTIGIFADIVGIVGVTLILIAYFLLQFEKMNSNSVSYSMLNLVGAAMILYSLFYHWNLASVIIEIAWIIISIAGIFRSLKRQRAVGQLDA